MNVPNALVSNGTCYYAASAASSRNVIPCGNIALGAVFQCCQADDYCLDDSFCWNEVYNTTYLAGCTDTNYLSPLCPPMGTSPQSLLPLTTCADSEGSSLSHSNPAEVLWSACPYPPTASTPTIITSAPSACECTGTASGGLLWAAASQSTIARLPSALGGGISFAAGRTPSMSLTTITASRDGLATTMVVPAAFSGGAAAAMSSSAAATRPLSTGATAGIGIGAAAVGLAAVGMGVACFVCRRRRRGAFATRRGDKMGTHSRDGEEEEGGGGQPREVGGEGSVATSANDTEDGTAWAWGYKSELPAESRHVHRVELPAEEVVAVAAPAAVGRRSEDGGWPVSPMSPTDDGAPMSGDAALSPVSSQLLDGGAPGGDGSGVREVGERLSEERRYGEGTRLEAIPEAVSD